MGAAKSFEVSYKLNEFAKIVNKTERQLRSFMEKGLPSYKEGKSVTLKISDYENWREQRRRVK